MWGEIQNSAEDVTRVWVLSFLGQSGKHSLYSLVYSKVTLILFMFPIYVALAGMYGERADYTDIFSMASQLR